MNETADRNYLGKLALEGAVIVASILIAFAIDAWWDESQEREEEARLLATLLSEIELNLPKVDQEVAFRQGMMDSAVKILEQANSKSIGANEFDRLLASLIFLGRADFSVGALDTILSGGALSVVEDTHLRAEIAELRVWIDRITSNEDVANARELRLEEFLLDHASLPQLSNAGAQREGGQGDEAEVRNLPSPEQVDHRPLLESRTFSGHVTRMSW